MEHVRKTNEAVGDSSPNSLPVDWRADDGIEVPIGQEPPANDEQNRVEHYEYKNFSAGNDGNVHPGRMPDRRQSGNRREWFIEYRGQFLARRISGRGA